MWRQKSAFYTTGRLTLMPYWKGFSLRILGFLLPISKTHWTLHYFNCLPSRMICDVKQRPCLRLKKHPEHITSGVVQIAAMTSHSKLIVGDITPRLLREDSSSPFSKKLEHKYRYIYCTCKTLQHSKTGDIYPSLWTFEKKRNKKWNTFTKISSVWGQNSTNLNGTFL